MEKQKKQIINIYSLVILAFFLLALPIFFLSNETLAGIFSILGILLFVISIRLISNKKQFFIMLVLLYLAQAIRFSTLLGYKFSYILTMLLCFIPFTLLQGIAIIIEKYLEKKKLTFLQILMFPLTYTILMIGLVLLNLGNEINLIIYLMLCPLFTFNLSIFGEVILTFLLALLISLIASVITLKGLKKTVTLALTCILLLSFIINDFVVLSKDKNPDYYLNVAIATHEEMDFEGNSDVEYDNDYRLNVFKNSVEKAKSNNADLLVLNEEFCTIYEKDYESNIAYYSKVIKDNQMPTLVCIDLLKEDLCLNEAIFFDNNGNIVSSYVKNNLVPFMESSYYEKGNENPGYLTYNFNGKEVNISYIVCFDVNDSFFVNKINENTELLIAPSWDWNTSNEEQKRIRIRSVELNTTFLKHTYEGYSYVTSPYSIKCDFIDNRNTYEEVKMISVPIYEKNN